MNPNVVLCVMITSGFGIGTFIAVGVLLIQQLKIGLTNTTGIEQWILEKAKWRRTEILKTDEKFQYPYNLGWYKAEFLIAFCCSKKSELLKNFGHKFRRSFKNVLVKILVFWKKFHFFVKCSFLVKLFFCQNFSCLEKVSFFRKMFVFGKITFFCQNFLFV